MEMNGLYTIGCLLPEFKAAEDRRSFALESLNEELTNQFYPDGAQIELTQGYHNVAVNNTMSLFHKAKVFDRMDEVPEGFLSKVEEPYMYYLKLMTPPGLLPNLNDLWNVWAKRVMGDALRLFPENTDFQWLKSARNKKELALESHVHGIS